MSDRGWKRTEREAVIRFLKRRAEFWGRFPAHRDAAKILLNEAAIIELGRHTLLPTAGYTYWPDSVRAALDG